MFKCLFSGCIGALRENTFFLAIYSSLLGLLLLAELCVIVLGFISKDWIELELKTRLDDMVILDFRRVRPVVLFLGHIVPRRSGLANAN